MILTNNVVPGMKAPTDNPDGAGFMQAGSNGPLPQIAIGSGIRTSKTDRKHTNTASLEKSPCAVTPP